MWPNQNDDQLVYEAELKYIINTNQITSQELKEKKTFQSILERHKFKKIGKFTHSDEYFQHPCRDFQKTDEALRVRTTSLAKDKNKFHYLTYKGVKLFEVGKTRQEIEYSIDSIYFN